MHLLGPTGPLSSSAEREVSVLGERRNDPRGEKARTHDPRDYPLTYPFTDTRFQTSSQMRNYDYVYDSTRRRRAGQDGIKKDDKDGYVSSLFRCKTCPYIFAITHEEQKTVKQVISEGNPANKWRRNDPCLKELETVNAPESLSATRWYRLSHRPRVYHLHRWRQHRHLPSLHQHRLGRCRAKLRPEPPFWQSALWSARRRARTRTMKPRAESTVQHIITSSENGGMTTPPTRGRRTHCAKPPITCTQHMLPDTTPGAGS